MKISELWQEITGARTEDNIPNVVRLDLPKDRHNEGAAWIYIPEKDTIYIGPPGSYHVDVSLNLKNLVKAQKGEKLVTGVLYDDGYADIFQPTDNNTEGRLLAALQMYHDNNYASSFNDMEDDAGAWDEIHGPEMVYPHDAYDIDWDDDDEDDEKSEGGKDTTLPSLHDHWLKDNDKDYSVMKDSPGAPKPISEWSVQDYLDWRDKKYHNSYGWGTPREDYPHFRWSYGDSSILPGCPHEGLWVWPTQNGYPDHFAQTGANGLGYCSQGRIYAHQGDRWEILTWPDRPRKAPNTHIRDIMQRKAAEAVKDYVMEKMGVPENKIFFTKMGYGEAVSWYSSPSYPGDTRENWSNYYKPKNYVYDYEPLTSWNVIPQGSWNRLKDPSGNEWMRSTLEPDIPGTIRLFPTGNNTEKGAIHIDPNTEPVQGWEIGEKREVDEKEPTVLDEPFHSSTPTTDFNKPIEDRYDELKQKGISIHSLPKQLAPPGQQKIEPPYSDAFDKTLTAQAVEWHQNTDGTLSRIADLSSGPTLINWRQGKFWYQLLSPEEAYAYRIRWHEEDQNRIEQTARKMYPDLFRDPDDIIISPKITHLKEVISIDPEEYELAFRLHGNDWWRSFIPSKRFGLNNYE